MMALPVLGSGRNRQVKTPASEAMPQRTQLQIEDGHK